MTHLRCRLAALALVCLLSQNLLSQNACAQSLWHTDLGEARREAERLKRPILCHFGAEWCAPCQKMERTVFTQPAVIDQLRASAVCLKIDVDQHPELAQRFGVERFPTDVFIEPSGQKLMESTGFHPPDEYMALVVRASRRYSDILASRQTKPAAPVVTSPEVGGDSSQLVKSAPSMLMLEGYCPVVLQKSRQWIKGNSQIFTEYKGQQFFFTSPEARQEFMQNPDYFVPQFLGCDPVLLFTADRAVAGTIEWGAFYDNRLYLFTTEENRRNFKTSPDKYIRTRVVLDVHQIESTFR
ncbi:thioredoxin family protein [Planctomicrobium piriforme]|uniref:Thioredoxin-like n=1 Tax=Planctomicrobium piriforme TaxID=1576369 RepID=A0A1I3AYJ7_9PLAN|nr:thioredoxin family protein [Planctomicrobium piriforme]SFH55113.1 Thioredoxin-like [Planctomicrobium piriforme]